MINDREEYQDVNPNDEHFSNTPNANQNEPRVEEEPAPEVTMFDQKEETVEANKMSTLAFEKGFTVLRVSVYNFHNKKVKVQVNLKSESDAPNFYVPLGSLKAEIYSNKAKAIAYLHKIHPEKPFGEYSFEYATDLLPEENQLKEAEDKVEHDQDQQSAAVDAGTGADLQWPKEDTEFEGYQDEINCGHCTMLNPISSFKCGVCGNKLPHRD
jgi:hypothetical protein